MLALLLAGCDAKAPFRIGVLAGVSGRAVATGEEGRNGAMLAVEQRNAAGGLAGRRMELLVQDNGSDAQTARTAMQALLDAKVDAVVGPFSSFVAVAVLPMADDAQVPMLSPNATSSTLVGKDDQLLLMGASTRDATRAYAALLWQRGHRRLAMATSVEPRNAVYYATWRDEFSAAFRALGGELLPGASFTATTDTVYSEVVRQLLVGQPDGLVFVCQVVDAVRLAKQARRDAPELPLVVSDGAATEALLRLGGPAVEGILVGQPRDMQSAAPAYQAFVNAYQERFGRAPGYPAVMAYEAVTALAQAQTQRRRGQSLQQALLQRGPYPGLQGEIAFDAFGDVRDGLRFAMVRGGRFQALP